MTSKERAALRAKANPLEPIFQIGKEGISDNLVSQIDDALLKIRVHLETAPENPREFADKLAERLNAEVIQVIGGVIVIYRKTDKERVNSKKEERLKASGKKVVKKKVKIKGLRQRNREFEEKHPWAKYNKADRGGRR